MKYEHTPSEPALFHEYAKLFPMMLGEALAALREDVRLHGALRLRINYASFQAAI